MKLLRLIAKNYRSLRDVDIELSDLNLFIGANASGKSTILDTLRFLHEGVQARDFRSPVFTRGGIVHLAWKGEEANQIELSVHLKRQASTYEWSLRFVKDGYDFYVEEQVHTVLQDSAPTQLLHARMGEGWWWSGEKGERVNLKQAPTVCALSAAAADASFPARNVADFIGRWGFFDPNPFLLRRDWVGLESGTLDHYGRNLGRTLHGLSTEALAEVVTATQAIVGLPTAIDTRESESRFFFLQEEPGLQYRVHQMGVSSGTLRMLAMVTALRADPHANLIGIEEPENYIHPTALSSFVEYLLKARDHIQFMITTHSPLLLDFVADPAAVRIVQSHEDKGTIVVTQENPEDVQIALEESGFGLGEFYETKGFGAH